MCVCVCIYIYIYIYGCSFLGLNRFAVACTEVAGILRIRAKSSFMLFYFGQNTFVFHFCPLQNMLYEMSAVYSIVKFGYFVVL